MTTPPKSPPATVPRPTSGSGDDPRPDAEDLGDRRVVHPQRVAFAKDGMIATAHYLATRAGARMLYQGGNAVDAAVAAAFALGVCEPAASGLGGQTMMMLYGPGQRRTFALDGSSRAPNRVIPRALERVQLRRGYTATTVPSTPATLGYALAQYGTMPLKEVLAPAIELAENGYAISELQRSLTRRVRKDLQAGAAGPIFLKDGKTPYAIGARFTQPALAQTLKRIASKGVEDFYTGRIGRTIAADIEKHGGLIRRDDLANIPWPIERKPVSCRFDGLRVMTMPPPGAGRTLIEMLNVVTHLPKRLRTADTPEGALHLAELIRRAFLDRVDRPFDANFYPQVEDARMLSEDYAKKVSREIRRRFRPRGETTHLSVIDRHGHVVGLTQSIENVYGSCVASPDLGFLYNDYMSAFELEDMTHPYYLRPNAAPWASVAPTIVFRGRKPWLVIGSPGSERIVSSIMQVLLRLDRQSPYDAVAAPRIHCSLKGLVSLEATRMRTDIPIELERCGFRVRPRDPYSFYMGCVQLVVADEDGLVGVADPRRDGSASGPVEP